MTLWIRRSSSSNAETDWKEGTLALDGYLATVAKTNQGLDWALGMKGNRDWTGEPGKQKQWDFHLISM